MSISEGEAVLSSEEFGCLFVKTGTEEYIVSEINNNSINLYAIAPSKLRCRRNRGTVIEEKVLLFPGYIFFRCKANADIHSLFRKHLEIYKILEPEENNWCLQGGDRNLIEEFFQMDGRIGISSAYYEGDRIRVVDGYLKKYQGNIIRVNHRAKTAQIRIVIGENEFKIWLGFELIKNY